MDTFQRYCPILVVNEMFTTQSHFSCGESRNLFFFFFSKNKVNFLFPEMLSPKHLEMGHSFCQHYGCRKHSQIEYYLLITIKMIHYFLFFLFSKPYCKMHSSWKKEEEKANWGMDQEFSKDYSIWRQRHFALVQAMKYCPNCCISVHRDRNAALNMLNK